MLSGGLGGGAGAVNVALRLGLFGDELWEEALRPEINIKDEHFLHCNKLGEIIIPADLGLWTPYEALGVEFALRGVLGVEALPVTREETLGLGSLSLRRLSWREIFLVM